MSMSDRLPEPVYLKNVPREVIEEIDARYALVRTGHVSVHLNDGEWVRIEHRDGASRKVIEEGRRLRKSA